MKRERYGPWAVVTGASSGIGREMAILLAREGLKLVLVARRAEELKALAATLGPTEVRVLPVDLAIPGGAEQVLAHTADLPVGLLVNSAGFGSGGELLAQDIAQEAAMVDVNCRAVLELTYGFAKRFVAQRRGGIVLLSSIVAFQGVPRSANYAATKAYIQSLGEALSEELAGTGVDVLTAAPGPTHSGFGARAGMRMGQAETAEKVAKGILDVLGRKRQVAPGLLSKVLLGSLMTAPRFLRVRIMKAIMQSMT